MVSGSRRSRNGPSVPAASTFAHAALVFLHGLLLDFSHPLRKDRVRANSRETDYAENEGAHAQRQDRALRFVGH